MRPIKEWTLEQLRRWSSAHNTFTLDFGDYEDDYVNVVTEEGEAMSQLIAGYIDIILKARVDTERVVADDDEDIAEEEMMTGQFGIANVGMTMSYSNPYGQGAGQPAMNDPGAQYSRQYPGQGPMQAAPQPGSQRVNVVDMGSAVKMTRLLGTELAAAKGKFGAPGKLTEEEWRKQFNQHRAKLDEKIADLIASGRLGPGALNRNQLDGKAKVPPPLLSPSSSHRSGNRHGNEQYGHCCAQPCCPERRECPPCGRHPRHLGLSRRPD